MENLCGNFQIINICCVSKVIKENIKKGHERCFCKLTFLLEITFLGKWLYHLEIFHYNNLTYMESINLSWGIYRTLRVWAKTLWKRVSYLGQKLQFSPTPYQGSYICLTHQFQTKDPTREYFQSIEAGQWCLEALHIVGTCHIDGSREPDKKRIEHYIRPYYLRYD